MELESLSVLLLVLELHLEHDNLYMLYLVVSSSYYLDYLSIHNLNNYLLHFHDNLLVSLYLIEQPIHFLDYQSI